MGEKRAGKDRWSHVLSARETTNPIGNDARRMAHSGSPTQIERRSPTGTPRPSAAGHSSVPAVEQRRVLDEHVRSIAAEFGPRGAPADLRRTRATLDQIAEIVGTGSSDIAADGYAHLLQHLTRVYAVSDIRSAYGVPTRSASSYARVVKALSSQCPACDFREAIGQLLDLMTRLFETRHPSWKSIFRLLRAIPESVHGRERLQRVCSIHLHEWFEAGIPNLFSQQKQLAREIEGLDLDIANLQIEIRIIEDEIETFKASANRPGDPGIAILATARKRRQIVRSQRTMREALDRLHVKTAAAALIESDIRGLGSRLRDAVRTYRLHMV